MGRDDASTQLFVDFSMAVKRVDIQLSAWGTSTTSLVLTVGERPRLLVADLGWRREEAAAARAELAAFEEGWDAPEMDAYDAL